MSIVDALLQRLPGLMAQGAQGKRAGYAGQRGMLQENEDRQRAAEREAIAQSLMAKREEREAALHPVNLRRQTALAADEEAQAQGAGRYAPRPVAPPAERNIDPLSPEGITARKQLAGYEAGLRLRATDPNAPKPGKILPASAVSNLSGMENVLNAAREAQTALQEANAQGMNVTGPITGRLTGISEGFGFANPAAVSVRGKLANVTSEIMKQRSGGAITPQEFVRLEPFLANKNDREDNAAQKLADLIAYLEGNLSTTKEGFTEAGYRVGGAGEGAAPDEAEAQAAAWLAKRRAKNP